MDHSVINWIDLTIIGLYLLVMLGIGVWFVRRVKNENDFYVAGRSLGPVVIMATVCATIVGGSAMMGIQKPVVKAHGNSDEYAFQHAIRQAVEFVRADVNGEIERNIQHMTVSPKNPVEKLLETIPTAKKD